MWHEFAADVATLVGCWISESTLIDSLLDSLIACLLVGDRRREEELACGRATTEELACRRDLEKQRIWHENGE